jgi:beta-lactamase class A
VRTVHKRVVQKKRKKVNPIVYLLRLTVVFSLLAIFMYYVFPTCFNRLIKQVFVPQSSYTTSDVALGMATKGWKNPKEADLYAISNPVANYLSNDLFFNRMLMTPTIEKTHSEVTTMYQTSEIASLKGQLTALMKQYPMIQPAVYVWEYENGQYIDINADKQYSAASIIKLPVLVRMFKSIEANQMTIYDEMILTDYYKSSGSGDLQYSQTGRKFSLDALAKTMIQDSDNSATNMIISKLGGMDDVNIGLRDWGISKTYVKTWLPDLTGTNKTTAKDMAKILYNLDNPGFLNINSREYIIDYMSHVKNNKLLAAGIGDGAVIIHKTGDIGKMLGDAGIVYAPNGKKYIVVILANRPHNAPQGKDFIVKASGLIYKSIVG